MVFITDGKWQFRHTDIGKAGKTSVQIERDKLVNLRLELKGLEVLYLIVREGQLLAYSVEKLVCEMSSFATLILMRGLCSG
jgi:hypothetical protein